jgi:Domain of unknown function (DUF1963)
MIDSLIELLRSQAWFNPRRQPDLAADRSQMIARMASRWTLRHLRKQATLACMVDRAQLSEKLERSSFRKHAEYLLGLARPAIDMCIVTGNPGLGASKFGGSPDLPEGTEWPESPNGPYRFVAQIDCTDLPDVGSGLPTNGLLSLFVAVDSDDGKFFWQSPGYVKAFFIPPGASLAAVDTPTSLAWAKSQSRLIRFRAGLDLPFDGEQAANWPAELNEDGYSEFRESLRSSPHYLLGYPSHCSLGYNPAPGPTWLSLLNLDSDKDLIWEWHDADRLMVFIEQAGLAAHDFSNLASDAG